MQDENLIEGGQGRSAASVEESARIVGWVWLALAVIIGAALMVG